MSLSQVKEVEKRKPQTNLELASLKCNKDHNKNHLPIQTSRLSNQSKPSRHNQEIATMEEG